jgi:hypothetical protein
VGGKWKKPPETFTPSAPDVFHPMEKAEKRET